LKNNELNALNNLAICLMTKCSMQDNDTSHIEMSKENQDKENDKKKKKT